MGTDVLVGPVVINGLKVIEGRFRLDIKTKFFPVRVVKHWSSFFRTVVDASFLEIFKVSLDRALSPGRGSCLSTM